MNLSQTTLAILLAAMTGAAAAQTPAQNGALPVAANRIVGLWSVTVTIGPCAGGPTRTFIAYNTFHAGGTLSDTNAAPPTTRGPGQGIWQYRGRGQYKTRFQFYRYQPDGSYDGIADIRTTVQLNAHATQYTNTIYARNVNPDGSLLVELCGSAVGERVGIN